MYEKRKYQQFKIKCRFCVVRLQDETLEEHEYFEFKSRAKKRNANHEKSEWKKINEARNKRTNEQMNTHVSIHTLTFTAHI